MNYTKKEGKLIAYMENLVKDGVAVAFSGGVDSTLVLKLATDAAKRQKGKKNKSETKDENIKKTRSMENQDLGQNAKINDLKDYKGDLSDLVIAFTFDTVLNPKKDLDISKSICEDYKVKQVIIRVDEINNPKILFNDKLRCYHCKHDLFLKIIEGKKNYDLKYVLDGSNGDDENNYRPGKTAAKQLGVLSPLAICGFTKKEVREFAEKLGIKVANRPSSPCMMTRYPYDTRVDLEQFEVIERLETKIKDMGIYNVRVRVHGDIARIEVDKEKIPLLVGEIHNVVQDFKRAGFKYVTVDVQGFRSGSMDE